MTPFDAILVERAPGIGQSARRARLIITLLLILAPIVLQGLWRASPAR